MTVIYEGPIDPLYGPASDIYDTLVKLIAALRRRGVTFSPETSDGFNDDQMTELTYLFGKSLKDFDHRFEKPLDKSNTKD